MASELLKNKSILEQAVDDVEFYIEFPNLQPYRQVVWLFLMELVRRKWMARSRLEALMVAELLNKSGPAFVEIEKCLWEQRVHFAAAIARIRIKNKAFTLSELLPQHLREEKVSACVNKTTVTGWVNTFKAKKVALLVQKLHNLGYSYTGSRQLCAGEYRFDRVCPRFITLRPPKNQTVTQLDLVKSGVIVLQEREFCEGASTFCRALRANDIQGVVAQTHASSPRSSAYLAAQLRELAAVMKNKAPSAPLVPELGRLIVFGAGDKVESYIHGLKELGVEASGAPQSNAPVCVLSYAVHCDNPIVDTALEEVVAVLATPPNSYSSVSDPIDLVCGRGGDLAMLEILTESEINADGKARVQEILEEQNKTLKALLSKPQIQLVLYETHSALEAENQDQVARAVEEANRMAKERHLWVKRKSESSVLRKNQCPMRVDSCESDFTTTTTSQDMSEDMTFTSATPSTQIRKEKPSPRKKTKNVLKKQVDRQSNASVTKAQTKARPIPQNKKVLESDNSTTIAEDDKIPHCDLFEIGKLPNLGNGLDLDFILDRDGCYLGLIRRKEIIRLDARYMIGVAEERGMFAGAQAKDNAAKKKEVNTHTVMENKRKRRKDSFQVDRIAAPTHASLLRSSRVSSAKGSYEIPVKTCCSRHARHEAAASIFSAASCTCDAKHRRPMSERKRPKSLDDAVQKPNQNAAPAATSGCRELFPIVIHDLHLYTMQPQSWMSN